MGEAKSEKSDGSGRFDERAGKWGVAAKEWGRRLPKPSPRGRRLLGAAVNCVVMVSLALAVEGVGVSRMLQHGLARSSGGVMAAMGEHQKCRTAALAEVGDGAREAGARVVESTISCVLASEEAGSADEREGVAAAGWDAFHGKGADGFWMSADDWRREFRGGARASGDQRGQVGNLVLMVDEAAAVQAEFEEGSAEGVRRERLRSVELAVEAMRGAQADLERDGVESEGAPLIGWILSKSTGVEDAFSVGDRGLRDHILEVYYRSQHPMGKFGEAGREPDLPRLMAANEAANAWAASAPRDLDAAIREIRAMGPGRAQEGGEGRGALAEREALAARHGAVPGVR